MLDEVGDAVVGDRLMPVSEHTAGNFRLAGGTVLGRVSLVALSCDSGIVAGRSCGARKLALAKTARHAGIKPE